MVVVAVAVDPPYDPVDEDAEGDVEPWLASLFELSVTFTRFS